MKIYLNGFMGAGKSYWGRILGQKLSLPFFDLDEQIVQSAGKPVTQIFAQEGEEAFRVKEKHILEMLTADHNSFVIACGGGTACFFNNIEFMNKFGLTVWIKTPASVLYARLVRQREDRPLLKDLTEEQLRAFIHKKFSDRKMYYQQCAVIIDEEEISAEKFIEKILHA